MYAHLNAQGEQEGDHRAQVRLHIPCQHLCNHRQGMAHMPHGTAAGASSFFPQPAGVLARLTWPDREDSLRQILIRETQGAQV
jgi:hypothetical protein